jgi:hypothetical protein
MKIVDVKLSEVGNNWQAQVTFFDGRERTSTVCTEHSAESAVQGAIRLRANKMALDLISKVSVKPTVHIAE